MYEHDDDGLTLIGNKTPGAFNINTPIGTTVGGVIVDKPVERDVTDFHTKEVRTFPDGTPMKQYVIRVQTDQRDPEIEDDDGVRAIYVKGWNKKRLKEAVQSIGARKIQVGGQLFDTFTSIDGQHKVHTYRYVAPTPGQAPPRPAAPVASSPMPPAVAALGVVDQAKWDQMDRGQRDRLIAATGGNTAVDAPFRDTPPF
jgi:hypothetical protein